MIQSKFSVNSKTVVFVVITKNVTSTYMHLFDEIRLALQDAIDYNDDLDGVYEFMVCLHKSRDLVVDPSKSRHYMFGQEYFDGRTIDDKDYYPVIHVLREDIVNEKTNINKIIKYRYANVIESSIWNYRVIYKKYKHGNIFGNNDLTTILRSISNNTLRKLYELCVTREYAELNARMTRQAYLEESLTSNGRVGGHAQYVSPFTFHSEREISELIRVEFNEDLNKIEESATQTRNAIKTHKWRILLVDDKSEDPMRNALGNSYNGVVDIWDNKTKVIKGLLESYFSENFQIESSAVDKYTSGDSNMLIEYVSNKKGAFDALKKKEYDLILLDYLLENGTHFPEYGHDILNDIADDKNLRNVLKIGPNGKLYFLFISAYSSAIRERLLADGLNTNEDYWQISVGACPINTPQLFLYNLIKMMERRLEDSGILKLSSKAIFELINKIFLPKDQDFRGDSVRKRANVLFQKVLSLQYHYRSILKDVEIPFGRNVNVFDTKGSVLMTDFIQKKINLGGMLEHLTQLVHLTAFGTVRQWPEMWEEYIYFKAQFEKQLDVDEDSVDCKYLFSNIESYILGLKYQQL